MRKSLEQRVAELEKKMNEITGNNVVKIGKQLGVGDTFELADLTWKILDITDKGHMCLAERLDNSMRFDANSNDWRKSSLREHLNGSFFTRLSEAVGENNIIPFDRDLLSLDGQTEYGACEDKVSLLTVDEYRKYRSLIPNDDSWWWLITPWSTPCNGYETLVAVVSSSGDIRSNCCDGYGGVRPVCIFPSAIFESGDK